MDFPKAEKKRLERKVDSHDIIDFLADYIRYDKLGLIANAHLVQADINENGIFSDECHKLAEMHSEAVDFAKTGITPKLENEHRPKVYPDFMMKKDKQIYSSTKIIGKLFRQCRSIQWMQKQPNRIIETDEDFIFELFKFHEKITQEAKQQKMLYQRKVLEVLDLYGIRTEAEAISGYIHCVKPVKGCLRDEIFQIGKIVKTNIAMIQKQTRESFFSEFGGELCVQKSDSRVLKKALAWYLVTYDSKYDQKQHLDPSRPILSFPWIVADILVILKRSRNVQPNRLDHFLKDYYTVSEIHRKHEIVSLNLIKEKIKSILGHYRRENVEFITMGLEFSGTFKRTRILNMMILGMTRHEIMEKMKEQGYVNISGPSQEPSYLITNNGKKEGCVRIITDSNITKFSTLMKEYLSHCDHLRPVVQFLKDLLLKDTLLDNSNILSFADLIAVTIVFFSLSHSDSIESSASEYSDRKFAKYLLSVLKRFILGFRSWHLSSYCKIYALNLTFDELSQIASLFLHTYQRIAYHVDDKHNPFLEYVNFVDTSSCDEIEIEEQYVEFELPTSVLDSIAFATKFFEFQLNLKSGANVLFCKYQNGPTKLAAWGTEKVLDKIHEIIDKILGTTHSSLSSDSLKGHIIANGAYSLVFQGGCDKSELFFEKYHRPSRDRNDKREMFIPKIKDVSANEDNFPKDFEQKFLQQWNVLKSEYTGLLHGELSMNISFGMFFVMNYPQHDSVNVMDLNHYFNSVDQRKKQAQQRMEQVRGFLLEPVPYLFSFQPVVNLSSDRIRIILENLGFTDAENEIEKRISLRMNSTHLFNFNENGKLCSLNFPDIRWSMITVVPGSHKKQHEKLKHKIQITIIQRSGHERVWHGGGF